MLTGLLRWIWVFVNHWVLGIWQLNTEDSQRPLQSAKPEHSIAAGMECVKVEDGHVELLGLQIWGVEDVEIGPI